MPKSSATKNSDLKFDALGTRWFVRFYGVTPSKRLTKQIIGASSDFE
ncbi:MAG: hypothetical protein ACE5DX_04410 [Candidatus Dojkabacteria bacterium]